MQINEFEPISHNKIQRYLKGEIIIANHSYKQSIFISPIDITELTTNEFTTITEQERQLILDCHPEVLLIGTGDIQRFPPNQLLREFMTAQIGTEVMDTASACRTFNLLLSESRHVAALLYIEKP